MDNKIYLHHRDKTGWSNVREYLGHYELKRSQQNSDFNHNGRREENIYVYVFFLN